jgi:surface antigen
MTRLRRSCAAMAGVVISLAIAAPVSLADPPPHAPAHGWRKKNDPYYVGYTGRQWTDDYGIRSGRCDRDRSHVATAVGAVAGGVIGNEVASGDNKLIAILAGAAIGGVIGNEIDKELDDDDRRCFGHSLELLEDGSRVRWDGSRPNMFYSLTPTGRFERDGRVCRRFTLVRDWDGKKITRDAKACRHGEGEWRLIKG